MVHAVYERPMPLPLHACCVTECIAESQVIVGVSVVLSLARPRRTPRWRLILKVWHGL